MLINGNEYNFGRVIYLTLIRRATNAQVSQKWSDETLEGADKITICFDPARDQKLNTRIDFYVKRLGDAGVGNNGFYKIANIDVWNIGPALGQFLKAYKAYENGFQDVNTCKYAAVLQVGYKGGKKTTLFAGHISSFVLERQQSNTSVDNVWHFFCQYPDPQQNNVISQSKAQSGIDYSKPEYWTPMQSFTSWESFLKAAVMAHPRTIYTLQKNPNVVKAGSFELPVKNINASEQDQLMCPVPRIVDVTGPLFRDNFKIEYRVSRNGVLLKNTQEYWQQEVPLMGWELDVADLQKTVSSIARAVNCHARVELDDNTGMQYIYIYPAGWSNQVVRSGPADFVITDYRNLRTPPQVSANMLHLDMLMEPSMEPGNLIELRISEGFLSDHPHPTFEPNFTMSNTATVFAGANFIGLAQMGEEERKKNAIASAGNIFNTKFVATIVEFRGSSHTAEWSTKVDCYGVVVNGKEITA